MEKAAHCRDLGVDAINVPDGPRAMARMSSLATAVIIERRVGMETLMHFACRDRNLLGIQSDLLGAAGLGLQNVLAITGDPPKLGPYPNATAVFDVDAIGLVNILSQLNRGLDLGGSDIGMPTRFSIGVGANPVAVDLERERKRFRYKVEAGAEWAMTQPIFDPDALFRFLDFASPFGIPIIAGIWPLKSLRNAEFMANEVPGVRVPPAILARMARWTSAEDQLKEGLAIARETIDRVRPVGAGPAAVRAPGAGGAAGAAAGRGRRKVTGAAPPPRARCGCGSCPRTCWWRRPADARLQDIADAAGADITFGCRSGSCGTCRVRVLAGLDHCSPMGPEERDFLRGLDAPRGPPPGLPGAGARAMSTWNTWGRLMTTLSSLLLERVLLLDGGMGTQILARKPTVDDFGGPALEGCMELLNERRPEWIREIHAAYLDAGADAVETNTFGANEVVLGEFGMARTGPRN